MNTGFIDYKPSGSDYIFEPKFGGSIDWKKYLPSDEAQIGVYMDSMACVSYSALNSLEMLIQYLDDMGELDTNWLRNNGYYENGRPNFSDRFTAKMSGTTRQGNTFNNVAISIRNDGLVPDSVWHFPNKQRTPVFDWNEYYKEIPQEIKDKGKEFLKHYEIVYTFFQNFQINEVIKEAPAQIAVYAWDNPINGVYQRTDKGINHAITYFEDTIKIYDSYDPYVKTLAKDYIINLWNVYFKIKNKPMEFYKEADSNTVYILGKGDGLYHPIYSGKVALDVFTKDWNSMNIKIITIPKDKIGYRIGGFI
jgi:hypothetical protein